MCKFFITLSLSVSCLFLACKVDADFPTELSPKDFFVSYTLSDSTGNKNYQYRGEQIYSQGTEDLSYSYAGYGGIQSNFKYIGSKIVDDLGEAVFSLQINQLDTSQANTSDTTWAKSELETLLIPGTSINYGEGYGQAKIWIKDHPVNSFELVSSTDTNLDGSLHIESVEDYGSPETGIPFSGKIVSVRFSGKVFPSMGLFTESKTITNGHAVLFFPYKF
jgi:hypothetical protein